jgi:hypothetical protein
LVTIVANRAAMLKESLAIYQSKTSSSPNKPAESRLRQRMGRPFTDWSEACSKIATLQRVLFAFRIDTASELLPKRFGRPGLGPAKQHPHQQSRNEFSTEKSEKVKTKGNCNENSPKNIHNDPVRACLLCQCAKDKGSSASGSATERVLPRLHNRRRLPRPSKPYHRHWKHRSWLAFTLFGS